MLHNNQLLKGKIMQTTIITLDELRQVIKDVAGEGSGSELDGQILDTAFTELGLDSLAVLEIATRLQDTYRIPFPDETIDTLMTPHDILNYLAVTQPVEL